jgi:tryptophan 2,3-dioxygenase
MAPGHGSGSSGGPVLPGEGATDYERYMRVDALLALQKKPGELAHHDELLFQTMHQAFELWLHQVLFEFQAAAALMRQDKPLPAANLVVRSKLVMEVLERQIHVLDTMGPWDFHEVRRQLGRGSGAESPGFRAILAKVPPMFRDFEGLLARSKVTLDDVYLHPEEHYPLFRLAEALTDFDMAFQLWRHSHLGLVKRIIGRDVKSLKGYSVHQLEEDVQMNLFPPLWQVRNRVTDVAGTSPA